MDQHLLQLQIDLYNHLKRRVREIFGEESPELTRYRRDHQKLAKKKVSSIPLKEFTSRLKKASLIFLGDFHTFDQNIKNFERIIRQGFGKKKVGIGIEFVNSDHQIYIDQFMKDEIDEYQFLENIHYSESWRFPWTHYRQIFQLAKDNHYTVIALNSVGKLRSRDQHAADLIANYLEDRDARLIVLFGEYHLVADKLPAQVKKRSPKTSQLTIHQNIDQLYWKLHQVKGEAVFSFNQHELLILSSPPWIKYESMIYWYENLSDDPDFDIHQYIVENQTKTFSDNVDESFVLLCRQLVELLGMELKSEDLEDFNLLDHRKLTFLHKLISKDYSAALQRFYRKLIKNGKSFKLVGKNSYYCSNYSMNRLSFLAGVHLHSLVLKRSGEKDDYILEQGDQIERFFYLLHQSLFSYFCSKLLNPYRKCDLYTDVVARIELPQTSQKKKKNLQLALKIIDHPHKIEKYLAYYSLRGLHSTAKTIGNMLGEWIFENHFKNQEIVASQLLPELLGQIYNPRQFSDFFLDIFSQSKFKSARKRRF